MSRPLRVQTVFALMALGVVAVGATSASAQGQSQGQGQGANQCFRSQDWRGSRAAGPREAYIRVGTKDVYRLTFAQDCPGSRYPGEIRIGSLVSGNNMICSPVDLQITVAPAGSSMSSACIVKDITRLTSDQIAALPKKVVP